MMFRNVTSYVNVSIMASLSRCDDFNGQLRLRLIAVIIVFFAQLNEVLLLQFLVFADKFRQIVGNGDVQLVDWAALEVCAGFCQLLEIVKWIQTEEVEVDLWIGQIVSRDVGEGRETFIDVVVLWMFNDLIGDLLLVAEQSLLVVVSGQVAIDHLSVVTDANLRIIKHHEELVA